MFNTRRIALWISPIFCLALAGCDGEASDPLIIPAAQFGKVTGLHPAFLASGTYTLDNCINQVTEASVSRRISLGTDGTMKWLAGDGAVLFQLAPSDTIRQQRSADIYRSSNGHQANTYSLYFYQPSDAQAGTAELSYQVTGRANDVAGVNVIYAVAGDRVTEFCGSTQTISRVATIPYLFTTAIAHELLASLVTLNGAALAAPNYSYFGSQQMSVTVGSDGRVVTQVAGAGSPTPWGETWVEGFTTDTGGIWRESYDTLNSQPRASLVVQHPTHMLTLGGSQVGQPFELRLNGSGNGSPVIFHYGSL